MYNNNSVCITAPTRNCLTIIVCTDTMSQNLTLSPRVRFLLPTDKSPDEVPLHDSVTSLDNPPPWEPQFEDVSSLSSLPSCRRPLDPPPRCFSTPSPLRIRSHDFPTFRVPSVSGNLADGFRALYPCNVLEGHGIGRADWVRFLEDLGVAASLAIEGRSAVGSRVPFAPLLTHGVFPSPALGAVYAGRSARGSAEQVCALIQIWNLCAFERRKIRASLEGQSIMMNRKENYMLVLESL